MMNKKGFTVIELVVCFVLVSIIVVGMLTIALNYRKDAKISEIELELKSYKINLTEKIQEDVLEYGVDYVKYCSDNSQNCVEIGFNNSTTKTIEISSDDPVNRYIKYDGEKFMIEEDLDDIDNPTLNDVSIILPLNVISLSTNSTFNNTIYSIDIPISHTLVEGDYGIHLVVFASGINEGMYNSKVLFDANGGSVDTSYKYVSYGSVYGSLPTASMFCTTFVGWYTEKSGGDRVDEDTIVDFTRNHTLYARYEGDPNCTAISFYTYGGTLNQNEWYVSVKYGSPYPDLPTPYKYGYSFSGWYIDDTFADEKKVGKDTVVNNSEMHYLHAKYTAKECYVTFMSYQGGVGTKLVTFDEKYGDLPPAPYKDGYTFNGWYTSNDCNGDIITKDTIVNVVGGQTLFACYK